MASLAALHWPAKKISDRNTSHPVLGTGRSRISRNLGKLRSILRCQLDLSFRTELQPLQLFSKILAKSPAYIPENYTPPNSGTNVLCKLMAKGKRCSQVALRR